ncbi:unnamed protein product [Prorocentrum cordatum]|uniref:Uncharacterized protein n=1 Tax=Prorocentrum cordatum TaxID=2364126 RepID=A0ABN9QJS9_9DINO|nr:unnamed protein product [Polarella glacialis]
MAKTGVPAAVAAMESYSHLNAEELLYRMNGQLLRLLAQHVGGSPEGIATAARQLRRDGKLSGKICNNIVMVDEAYHLTRHITDKRANSFYASVVKDLNDNEHSEVKPVFFLPGGRRTVENAHVASTCSDSLSGGELLENTTNHGSVSDSRSAMRVKVLINGDDVREQCAQAVDMD